VEAPVETATETQVVIPVEPIETPVAPEQETTQENNDQESAESTPQS